MAQGTGKYNPDDEVSLSDLLPGLIDTPKPSGTAAPAYYPAPPPTAAQPINSPPPLPGWAQFTPTEAVPPPAAKPGYNAPPLPPTYSSEIPTDFLLTAESPVQPKKKKENGIGLSTTAILVLAAAVLIVPTLVFGLFFVIANSQPEAKPLSGQELANAAKTPLTTIKPETPAPGGKPANGTPPAKNVTPVPNPAPTATFPPFEFKNDCGYKFTVGKIDAFPCSKPLPTEKQELRSLITAADKQLSDSGNKPLGNLRYDYATDKAERVQEFYSGMLRSMGYNQEQDSPSGTAKLGSYRVLYYNNGQRRIQVVIFSIGTQVPGGVPAAGDIAIRISAN